MEQDSSRGKTPDGVRPAIPPALPVILLKWYDQNARPLPWRVDTEPYHIWISEIMLQQTRVEAVKGYYARFLSELPTVEALAEADEQKLLKLWEGLGYYSRARNLQKAARLIAGEHGRFPDTYDGLRKLPGIGAYTAGAIGSICFNLPVPAVDGNVLRVISRIAGIYDQADTEAQKKSISASLAEIYPKERRGDFTQSLMELGATVCLPNGAPLCDSCPAADFCKAKNDGCVARAPGKPDKKPRVLEQITLFVFSCGDKIALRRRSEKGLLAGLWEFPNVHGTLGERQALEAAQDWKTEPVSILETARKVHIFTHIKWEMTCYYIECRALPGEFVWVDRTSLSEAYPLPTAFKMFL